MDFTITLDLNVSELVTFKDLLTINSIGFAIVVLSLNTRLTYLLSTNFHNDQYYRDLSFPTVIFANRISYYGILFLASILVQLAMFFRIADNHYCFLFNIAFLLTLFGFIVFLYRYIYYIIGTRAHDWRLFREWAKKIVL